MSTTVSGLQPNHYSLFSGSEIESDANLEPTLQTQFRHSELKDSRWFYTEKEFDQSIQRLFIAPHATFVVHKDPLEIHAYQLLISFSPNQVQSWSITITDEGKIAAFDEDSRPSFYDTFEQMIEKLNLGEPLHSWEIKEKQKAALKAMQLDWETFSQAVLGNIPR